MGKYCKLVAGKDYMEQESELIPARVSLAEKMADAFIDGNLVDWDKSSWTPETTPTEVCIIAMQCAASHYFLMQVAGSAPTENTPPLPKMLMDNANAGIDCIITRGFICGAGGATIQPISDGGQMPRCTR